MSSQVTNPSIGFITLVADMWILPTEDQLMAFQSASLSEGSTTDFAWICFMFLKVSSLS